MESVIYPKIKQGNFAIEVNGKMLKCRPYLEHFAPREELSYYGAIDGRWIETNTADGSLMIPVESPLPGYVGFPVKTFDHYDKEQMTENIISPMLGWYRYAIAPDNTALVGCINNKLVLSACTKPNTIVLYESENGKDFTIKSEKDFTRDLLNAHGDTIITTSYSTVQRDNIIFLYFREVGYGALSLDGGLTWGAIINVPDTQYETIITFVNNYVWAVDTSNGGGVWRLLMGSNSWIETGLNQYLGSIDNGQKAVFDCGNGVVRAYVGYYQYNNWFISYDYGNTFARITDPAEQKIIVARNGNTVISKDGFVNLLNGRPGNWTATNFDLSSTVFQSYIGYSSEYKGSFHFVNHPDYENFLTCEAGYCSANFEKICKMSRHTPTNNGSFYGWCQVGNKLYAITREDSDSVVWVNEDFGI